MPVPSASKRLRASAVAISPAEADGPANGGKFPHRLRSVSRNRSDHARFEARAVDVGPTRAQNACNCAKYQMKWT